MTVTLILFIYCQRTSVNNKEWVMSAGIKVILWYRKWERCHKTFS